MVDEILQTDIAIVGAGLVGLSAAVALHQANFKVILIDAKQPIAREVDINQAQALDSRIYAISPKNAQWLASLGAWTHMDASRVGYMQAMEIFDHRESPLYLSAKDAHVDALGFIVESKTLMQALLQQVRDLGIITLFDTPCEAVDVRKEQVTLRLSSQKTLQSALLIAADSRQSWVRQQLDIPVYIKSYEQTALVANFKAEKSHVNTARQWFSVDAAGRNSILAWLPLPDDKISIVWSVSTELAQRLLAMDIVTFTDCVMQAGKSVLGKIELITPPVAFPLNLQKVRSLTHDSVVFVGDAAHQLHPMAGQGVNLGFRDVIDLVTVLQTRHGFQALNDPTWLKRYTRLRKTDLLKMLILTDGLYQLFERPNKAIQKTLDLGLLASKQAVVRKKLVEWAVAH